MLVADAVTFESLKEDDMLLAYQSHEAGDISSEFIDLDGTYYGTKVMATGIAVNRDNVKDCRQAGKSLLLKNRKAKLLCQVLYIQVLPLITLVY